MEPISRKQTQEHCRRVLGRKPPKGLRPEITRHGKPIWVYRATGIYHQMQTAPGSVAFWQEFTDASRGVRIADATLPILKSNDPASLRWLVDEYIGSDNFAEFKPNTQKGHRNLLKRLAAAHGDVPFAKVQPRNLKDIRDHIAKFGSDPANPKPAKASANQLISAVRGMYKWAEEERELFDKDWINPCDSLKRKAHTSVARHKWSELECDKYEAAYAYGTRARLMYELLLTGQRCCDIVRMGPEHIGLHDDGEGQVEMMLIKQQKTGKDAWAPIPPNLRKALDTAKKAGVLGSATFVGSEFDGGAPISAGHFSNLMRRACDQIGVPECTAHGMRHYVATHLLEQGLGVEALMAVLGDTMERCQGYVREFEGKQVAIRAARTMGRNRFKIVKAA
jgi:integrase